MQYCSCDMLLLACHFISFHFVTYIGLLIFQSNFVEIGDSKWWNAFKINARFCVLVLAPTEALWNDILLNAFNRQPITGVGDSLFIPMWNRDMFCGQDGERFAGSHLRNFQPSVYASFITSFVLAAFLASSCLLFISSFPFYFLLSLFSPFLLYLLVLSLFLLRYFFSLAFIFFPLAFIFRFFQSSLLLSHTLFYLLPSIPSSFSTFSLSFFFSYFFFNNHKRPDREGPVQIFVNYSGVPIRKFLIQSLKYRKNRITVGKITSDLTWI
jgi:hypothetical protein